MNRKMERAPTVREHKLKVTVEVDGDERVRMDLLYQLKQDIKSLQGYTMAGGIAVREVELIGLGKLRLSA